MAKVLVPLAPGCEELEAITIIDLLRRGDIEVTVASLDGDAVRASRGTTLVPDTSLDAASRDEFDMIVLPGGMPGAKHLREDRRVLDLVKKMHEKGRFTAAICAAPTVLAEAGILSGKSATSYPGFLQPDSAPGIKLSDDPVVEDGPIITSRGPGTAMDFALTLVARLAGEPKRNEVERGLQRPGKY